MELEDIFKKVEPNPYLCSKHSQEYSGGEGYHQTSHGSLACKGCREQYL